MSQSALIAKSDTLPRQELNLVLKEDLRCVDGVIEAHLETQIPLIDKIAKHIIYAGGKRIRPCLTLASSQLFGNLTSSSHYLAAAVEFIHTATLLHDDVVDASDTRRSQKTAHRIWGNTAAILVGDFLFARAFELMVRTNNLDVLRILSHTAVNIVEGEVHQFSQTHNLNVTEETILKILGSKTAQLFGATCQTGALLGGASKIDADHLFQYGYNLGLVFQITDDVLDYLGSDQDRGKNIGEDFREGKVTLPIVYTYAKATESERSFIQRAMTSDSSSQEEMIQVIELINTYKGFETSLNKAREIADQALNSLSQISSSSIDTSMASLFEDTVELCLDRHA